MGKIKYLLGLVAIIVTFVAIYFVFSHEKTLVTHPKGLIAHKELKLITTNVILMVLILVPTAIVLLIVVAKYRIGHIKKYEPEETYGPLAQLILWTLPTIIVVIMALVNWKAIFDLDPYKPLESDEKHLAIQVVAIDWKWLFIYPEQGIATLNWVQFPEKKPIRFELAADGSPMNSFWIPELSGQIYCMTGMVTPLHVIADGPGEYSGKAAEINGDGYATMRFTAKSCSENDFEAWVTEVKKSTLKLDQPTYDKLLKPSLRDPVTYYSEVENDMFNHIVMKYMHPQHTHK
jgi:cytochrome o ubiquinol oxidase subunit 2